MKEALMIKPSSKKWLEASDASDISKKTEVNDSPIKDASLKDSPTKEASLNDSLTKKASLNSPTKKAPLNGSPTKKLLKNSLIKKASLNDSPTKKASLNDSPTKKTSLNDSPTKKASLNDSRTKKAALNVSPTKKASLNDSPTKKASLNDSPTKKASLNDSRSKKAALNVSPTKKASLNDSPTKKAALNVSPTKKAPLIDSPTKKASLNDPLSNKNNYVPREQYFPNSASESDSKSNDMQEILSSKPTCASTIMEVELCSPPKLKNKKKAITNSEKAKDDTSAFSPTDKCVSLDNLIQQNVTETTSLNKELDINQSALVKNSEVIKCDVVFKETKNSLSLVEPNPILLQSESPTDYSKISNTPELSDLPLCNPKKVDQKEENVKEHNRCRRKRRVKTKRSNCSRVRRASNSNKIDRTDDKEHTDIGDISGYKSQNLNENIQEKERSEIRNVNVNSQFMNTRKSTRVLAAKKENYRKTSKLISPLKKNKFRNKKSKDNIDSNLTEQLKGTKDSDQVNDNLSNESSITERSKEVTVDDEVNNDFSNEPVDLSVPSVSLSESQSLADDLNKSNKDKHSWYISSPKQKKETFSQKLCENNKNSNASAVLKGGHVDNLCDNIKQNVSFYPKDFSKILTRTVEVELHKLPDVLLNNSCISNQKNTAVFENSTKEAANKTLSESELPCKKNRLIISTEKNSLKHVSVEQACEKGMLTTINNEVRKSISFSAPVYPNVNKPRINIQPPLNIEKRVLPPPKKRIRPIPVTSPCDLSSSPFSSPAHLSMLEFPLKPKEIPTVPTNSSSGILKEVKDLPLPPFILEENRCKNERINSKYILDSESTISISGDPKFLSDSEPNVSNIEIQNSMFLPDIESGISDVMIDSKLISHPEKDASEKKADDSKLVPNSESNEIVDDSNILPEPNISDRVICDSKLAPNDESNTPRKAMKDSKLLPDSGTDEDSIIDSHPLSNSTTIMSPPHVQFGRRHLSGKPQSMMAFYKNAFPNKEIPISPDTMSSSSCTLETFLARRLQNNSCHITPTKENNSLLENKETENMNKKRKLSFSLLEEDKNYSNKEEASLVEVYKEKEVIQIENLCLRDESNKKCSLNNENNLLSEDTSEKNEISKELPTVSMKNSLNEAILINSHPNPESSLFDRVSTKKKTPSKAKLPSSFTKEDSDELIKSPLNQKKNLLFEVSSEKKPITAKANFPSEYVKNIFNDFLKPFPDQGFPLCEIEKKKLSLTEKLPSSSVKDTSGKKDSIISNLKHKKIASPKVSSKKKKNTLKEKSPFSVKDTSNEDLITASANQEKNLLGKIAAENIEVISKEKIFTSITDSANSEILIKHTSDNKRNSLEKVLSEKKEMKKMSQKRKRSKSDNFSNEEILINSSTDNVASVENETLPTSLSTSSIQEYHNVHLSSEEEEGLIISPIKAPNFEQNAKSLLGMKQKLESDNINSEQNNPNSGDNIPSYRESTSAEHFFRNIDLTVEKPLQASPIRSSLSDKMILKSSLKKSALNPKIPAGVKIPCKWTSSKITDYSNLIESNSIVSENMMDAKSSKKNKPTKFVGFKSPLKTNPVSKKQFSKDPTSYSYYEYRPNTFKTLYSERAARRLGIRRSPYRPSPNLSNRTRRNDRRESDISHSKKDVERSFSSNRHALDNRSIRDNAIDRCERKSSRNLTSNEVSIDKNAEKFKTSNKNFDQHSYLSNLPNSKNNEHDKHLRSCSISSDKLKKTETSIPNLKTLNKRQESSSNIFSNISEITTSKKAILSKNKFEPKKKSDKAIKTNKLSSDNSELLSEIKDSNEVEEIPIRSLAEQEELEKAVASLTNTEYLYPQNPVVPSKETPVKPFLDYSAIQDQISEAAKIIALGAGSLSGDTFVADQLQRSMENILKLIKEKP